MDIAKYILDDSIYSASDFSKLLPNELAAKRKHLVCAACNATAFFRKASRHGHTACFAARHDKSCPFFSTEALYLADESSLVVPESHMPGGGGVIEVELIYNSTMPSPDDRKPSNNDANHTSAVRTPVPFTSTPVTTSLSLSSLLKSLVNSIDFRASVQKIKAPGVEPISVSNFFVNLNETNSADYDVPHGFWGMLTDARLSSEGSLWLNFGSFGDISCVIPAEMVDEFYNYYHLEDEEDLAGAYALIIGVKRISPSGKEYIRPSEFNHITIRRLFSVEDLSEKFFINDKKKIAFFLKKNEKGIFDEELGIKKKHYLDSVVAREWRARMAREFHPDKNQDDTSLNYDEIQSCINKIYARMIGKA